MPNNIKGGRFNLVFAKQTVDIVDTPITASNVRFIFLIDDVIESHDPSLEINQFDSFVTGKSYMLKAIVDMDLTDIFSPPFTSGNAILWETGNPITPE